MIIPKAAILPGASYLTSMAMGASKVGNSPQIIKKTGLIDLGFSVCFGFFPMMLIRFLDHDLNGEEFISGSPRKSMILWLEFETMILGTIF